MHDANITRRPGWLQLIHMQMWSGAGAQERERGTREGDCMQWRAQESRDAGTALFKEAAEMWASTATDDRCHRERERRMEEWQLPLRRRIRRRWHDEGAFVMGQMDRSVTAPCYCAVAFAIAVLTLVEFTQAARVAEGAHRPWVPAAPALHPTLCGPDPTPRSLRHNAAPGPLHHPGEGGAEAATFSTQQCSVHTQTCILTHILTAHTYRDAGSTASASAAPLLHCFPNTHTHTHTHTHTRHTHIHRARHIHNSPPHASLSAVQIGERGSEWAKQKRHRSQQPAGIHTTDCWLHRNAPKCTEMHWNGWKWTDSTFLPRIGFFHSWTAKVKYFLKVKWQRLTLSSQKWNHEVTWGIKRFPIYLLHLNSEWWHFTKGERSFIFCCLSPRLMYPSSVILSLNSDHQTLTSFQIPPPTVRSGSLYHTPRAVSALGNNIKPHCLTFLISKLLPKYISQCNTLYSQGHPEAMLLLLAMTLRSRSDWKIIQ